MNLLVSKFRLLEFRLLLSRVVPYIQFFTTNCLIQNIKLNGFGKRCWYIKPFFLQKINKGISNETRDIYIGHVISTLFF